MAQEKTRWLTTRAGAMVGLGGRTVLKVHASTTEPSRLFTALAVAGAHPEVFVAPLRPHVERHGDGRAVTQWPRVRVLDPTSEQPWRGIGQLLARLHTLPITSSHRLPQHTWLPRLARARARLAPSADVSPEALVRRAIDSCSQEIERSEMAARAHETLVHGDFHLGQVAVTDDGLRLIDVDDLALGDPVWDLARPAGYHAAGLLPVGAWDELLAGYRSTNPTTTAIGDGRSWWPELDLPARAAVALAAARELTALREGGIDIDSEPTAVALVQACGRMPR